LVVGALSVKVCVVAVTVKLTLVETFVGLVGVIVIVCAAAGTVMLRRVEIVRETVTGSVPSKVTLLGLKLQDAPAGSPAQLLGLKFTTVPVEPAIALIVSVMGVEVCPAETVTALGEAESAKSGVSVAFHATASAFASTEPRPVTRLYPVVASAFDALYPMLPVVPVAPGHCSPVGQGAAGVPPSQ